MSFSILHVEDDPNDVFLMQEAFARAGMPRTLQVARDGEESIQYLEGRGDFSDRGSHPLPCLILLDLKLPKKTGLEVLQWIRTQPFLKRIPTIVMSSSMQAVDIDRAYDLGATAYLAKPIGLADLDATVTAIRAFWSILNIPPTLTAATAD